MTTSPRNPAKLRQELELLSRFDGQDWWSKDSQGLIINQRRFAALLAESDYFEGSISERYPELAARDRMRAPQMLGFAYVDPDGVLHITDAGWRLIRGERENELFLRQFLKWQFPSWQHGGNPRTEWRYHSAGVYPFRETVRAAMELGGVTKDEIALFLLPCLTPSCFVDAVQRVRRFREELAAVPGGRLRKEFVLQMRRQRMAEVYAGDIAVGRVDTRQIPASEGDKLGHLLEKKARNAYDYADAVMRYFRYTGIFTQVGNRLTISDAERAHRIITDFREPIRSDYTNCVAFYEYMGNGALPVLPWEQPDERLEHLRTLRKQITDLSRILGQAEPLAPPGTPEEQCRWLEQALTILTLENCRRQWTMDTIVAFYDTIVRRQVSDPPLFMEWNTWRAFLNLDHYCELLPNFSLDTDWQPIAHAGGRQADIEVLFCGKYVVAVEVTLATGERQFDTESEPVTRHVERLQQRSQKETFGLFVAPRLQVSTIEWFHYHATRRGVSVIPLTLEQFRSLLSMWSSTSSFRVSTFYDFLSAAQQACLHTSTSQEWLDAINRLVSSMIRNA